MVFDLVVLLITPTEHMVNLEGFLVSKPTPATCMTEFVVYLLFNFGYLSFPKNTFAISTSRS